MDRKRRGPRGPYRSYEWQDAKSKDIPPRTRLRLEAAINSARNRSLPSTSSANLSDPANICHEDDSNTDAAHFVPLREDPTHPVHFSTHQEDIPTANVDADVIAHFSTHQEDTTTANVDADVNAHFSTHQEDFTIANVHAEVKLRAKPDTYVEGSAYDVPAVDVPAVDVPAVDVPANYGFAHMLSEDECDMNDEEDNASEEESTAAGDNVVEGQETLACVPDDEMDAEDQELVALASQLHLSIPQKIKLLLLLATKKRHNLTYQAAEDIMRLAGVMAGDDEPFEPSKHTMKMAIKLFSFSLSIHHVCPACASYIGVFEGTKQCPNPKCRIQVSSGKNEKDGNVFLYLSLTDQLKALLENTVSQDDIIIPHQREKINKGCYEDIFDGTFYKKTVAAGEMSLNFFVDGVQIATTNKRAAWPILAAINEFALPQRRKYVMMASLWLSAKKPVINEYMKPFVEECVQLADKGVTIKRDGVSHTVKVKALMCVSDSIARPLLRNSTQFNGENGCGLCYHPGIKMQTGRGSTRSYTIKHQTYPLRTHEETMSFARRAEATGKREMGIKGKSILAEIPDFDIARSLDFDLFHALVNCAKRFANLWFKKSYRGEPFNVINHLDEVDKRLLEIQPTSDVSRHRSLLDRSDWRGHEWYYWVVFYSIACLKNVLAAKYLNHWSLVVHALALFMQNSVAKSEVAYAQRYLHQFVVDTHNLYGAENVTFSIHLLTHLAKSVEDFGQPWTHSAFIFESFNCEIKNAVKSSNGAALQICTNMQLKVAINQMKVELHGDMNDIQRRYLQQVTAYGKKMAQPHMTIGSCSLLDAPKLSTLPYEWRVALRRVGASIHPGSVVPHYDRCIINKEVFHSTNYSRASKTNNSVILLKSNRVFQVHSFVVFKGICYAIGQHLQDCLDQKLTDTVLPHMRVLKEPENMIRAVIVSELQSKLLYLSVEIGDNESLNVGCINVLKMEMLT